MNKLECKRYQGFAMNEGKIVGLSVELQEVRVNDVHDEEMNTWSTSNIGRQQRAERTEI